MFTRSVFLWGLFGAILPLVIHLINRHRARQRKFAAMDFLFRVQKMSAKKILLKQILLLIIRTLLLVFIVFAAAGPVLQDSKNVEMKGPTSLVLIVDCSFSMQAKRNDGRTMFDSALDEARSTILRMGPSDSACLVAAGSENKELVSPCTGSNSELLSALKKLKAGWSGCDLNGAISKAADLLKKAPGPNRKILVFSDVAQSAFSTGSIETKIDVPVNVEIFDVARGQDRSNRAVVDVDSSMDAGSLRVAAHLVQFGQDADVAVKVRMDGDFAARGFAHLAHDQVAVKIFSLQPKARRIHKGVVALNHDNLPGDDEQGFFVAEKGKIRALLVDGDMRTIVYRDELYYLEHALGTTDSLNSGVTFTTITPDRLNSTVLQGADVVFLANVRHLESKATTSLEEFVAGGGGLFVAMGDRVDVDQFNQEFEKIFPWTLRDTVSLADNTEGSSTTHGIAFGRVNEKHPVIVPLGPQYKASLGAVRTRMAVVIEPGAGSSEENVLISYSNGAPALLDGRYGMGRILMFTSSIDRDWTNWPARASFLPFLLSATRYLAGQLDMSPPKRVDVGSQVSIFPGEGVEKIAIRKPDGMVVSLTSVAGHNGKIVFSQTDIPGWYEIIRSGTKTTHDSGMPGFFVRIPPAESNLAPIAAGRLDSLLGDGARVVLRVSDGSDIHRVAWIFLILCLALLVCEGVLIRH